MDQLLSVNLAEGVYHSSSEFTLDSLRSRAKLAEFQLPEPGLWLAKLVQAAHLAGASQISIRLGRRRVEVEFDCQVPLRAQQLLEEVLSGKLYSGGLYFHLITGIRSSATALSESLQWTVGGEGVRLHPQGVDVFGASERPPNVFHLQVGLPSRTRSLWRTLASPVSQLARSTVEENSCIDQRCWFSPVPLKVDGRLLQPQLSQERLYYRVQETVTSVLSGYGRYHRYYLCALALRALQLEGRPQLKCVALPERGRFYKEVEGVTLTHPSLKCGHYALWPVPQGPYQAVLCLCMQAEAEVRVDYLLDGVLVDFVILPDSLGALSLAGKALDLYVRVGLRLLVAVEPAQVDLSHFQVRDRDNLTRAIVQQSLPLIQETLQFVDDNFSHFNYWPLEKKHALPAGVAAAAFTGVMALMSLPAVALVVGGNVVLSPLNFAMVRSMVRLPFQRIKTAADRGFGLGPVDNHLRGVGTAELAENAESVRVGDTTEAI